MSSTTMRSAAQPFDAAEFLAHQNELEDSELLKNEEFNFDLAAASVVEDVDAAKSAAPTNLRQTQTQHRPPTSTTIVTNKYATLTHPTSKARNSSDYSSHSNNSSSAADAYGNLRKKPENNLENI